MPTRSTKVVAKTVQCELGDHEFVEIMPIADIHLGDPSFDKKLWKSMCDWVHEKDYRYVVIAGDIFNAGIKDSKSSVYDETMTLQQAMDTFKEFVSMLGKDNIIAAIRGNHDNRVVRSVGLDPVAVSCELTGVKYCGAEGFIALSVGDWKTKSGKRSPVKYLMYLAHGTGGGRMAGGKVNGLLRHANTVVADIYVQGHTHTPTIIPDVVYVSDSRYEQVIAKDQLFVVAPSFIGRDGYAKDYCFAPLSHKFPVIRLSGRKKTLEAELLEI